ncbi:MAG: EamA family transporter RarD [Myxococcota bacterium]
MRHDETRTGLIATLSAFIIWGFAPLFWMHLKHIPSAEVLAHRIAWSAPMALALLWLRDRRFTELRALIHPAPGVRRALLLSTLLIAVNWFTFIWAVAHDRVTEASLGYYTNPLVNVVLGRIFLGERLSRLQWAAVGLAGLGVAWLALSMGTLPWVSLVLAFSFAFYGLVKKRAPVSPLTGIFVETGLWAPLCVAYLLAVPETPWGALTREGSTAALLVLSGAMTLGPLLLFAIGARRLPYSTVGMLQYLAPTLQLAVAVLVFGEPFTSAHVVTFACIWGAVGLFVSGSRQRRRS